jgi:hypothetical protein
MNAWETFGICFAISAVGGGVVGMVLAVVIALDQRRWRR